MTRKTVGNYTMEITYGENGTTFLSAWHHSMNRSFYATDSTRKGAQDLGWCYDNATEDDLDYYCRRGIGDYYCDGTYEFNPLEHTERSL